MSTIRKLAFRSRFKFSNLLRGQRSFGYYMERQGLATTPSPEHRRPDLISGGYYDGGAMVEHFGSKFNGGVIDAIQIELPARYRLANVGGSNRERRTANAIAEAAVNFFRHTYGSPATACGGYR